LNALVMPTGQHWGEMATRVQKRDAKAVLSASGPRRHWIGRARGYSKTEDLAALTLVALLVLLAPGAEAYCVARDRDQARILVDRIRAFIRRNGLEGAFESVGTYVIVTKSGVRLEALSCDVSSAYGLSPAWVVVDELCQHPETAAARELLDAIVSGLPKTKGSRLAIITTSGSPGHWSKVIYDRAERERGWRVSMTYGPAPWQDAEEVEEAKRALPASSFARLFRNEWAQGEDRLFDPDDVAACVAHDGVLEHERRHRYQLGVDLALRNDRAAVCAGHVEGDALIVDALDVFVPSRHRDVDLGAVESLVEARSRQYGRAPVVFDPAMAGQMVQRLRLRGVTCKEHVFTAASNSRRTLLVLQLVRERRLRLPDDPELIDELLNLRVREISPGQFRYDHDATKHDDRVTALSLVALLAEKIPTGRISFAPPDPFRKVRSPRPGARSVRSTDRLMLTTGDGRRVPVRRGSVQEQFLRRQGFLR
jgi:phage terminase large subunit-like protein